MEKITFKTEEDLIPKIKQLEIYKNFIEKALQPKIEREKKAWNLIQKYRGNYSKDNLREIFDTVDPIAWFGLMLSKYHKDLILKADIGLLNKWVETLLSSEIDISEKLRLCLKDDYKIKGISTGLVSFLYLKSVHFPLKRYIFYSVNNIKYSRSTRT